MYESAQKAPHEVDGPHEEVVDPAPPGTIRSMVALGGRTVSGALQIPLLPLVRRGPGLRRCAGWPPTDRVRRKMTTSSDDIPEIEEPDPLEPEDAAEIAPLDSETDFDDEQEEDQALLDEAEAAEAGVLLDDPEALSDEDE